jgi:hypothetical protein
MRHRSSLGNSPILWSGPLRRVLLGPEPHKKGGAPRLLSGFPDRSQGVRKGRTTRAPRDPVLVQKGFRNIHARRRPSPRNILAGIPGLTSSQLPIPRAGRTPQVHGSSIPLVTELLLRRKQYGPSKNCRLATSAGLPNIASLPAKSPAFYELRLSWRSYRFG